MAASKEGLIDNINCKLAAGGLTDIQASQLAGAAQALCCSSFYAVACADCLPNAALNKGRFIYIQDIGNYRYSDGITWTSNFSSTLATNLYTWGLNTYGQLGVDTTTSSSSAALVSSGSDAVCWSFPSAGISSTAVVKKDGTLWTWGRNNNCQLGNGTSTDRSSPGTVAGGGTNWSKVSIGEFSTGAIKTDGTLWTWGNDAFGSLGSGVVTTRNSPATTSGGGTNWCQISMRTRNAAGIKTDGTLWTWGIGTCGVLGNGSVGGCNSPATTAGGGTNWCFVNVGSDHMVAVKTDGTLWTWGRNGYGQLGDGTTTNRCSPGTVAGGGTTWCTAAADFYFVGAIKTDGTLWTWGRNVSGQLGTGNTTSRSSPGTTTGGGTNWCSISAGSEFFAALKTDGTLWTWGCNAAGQLGDGTTTSRFSPDVTAAGGNQWLKISAAGGGGHVVATVSCFKGF